MNCEKTPSYWEDLAERYFLAETTEQEEAELRRFLCSEEGQDSRFDEVRATMSFLHACRSKRRSSVKFPFKAVAVAACLCAAAFLGWHQYQQYNISDVRVAGQEVEADASLLMQKQMAEMFNPLDQAD